MSDLSSKPNGGLPPIYVCKPKKKEDELETKIREHKTARTTLSIKSILQKRRDINPFVKT